ncbi:MAG: hypothetical protein Q9165_007908 [Trypethelium subeluteriae]
MRKYALTTSFVIFYLLFSHVESGSKPRVWTQATACPTSINATIPGRNINWTPDGDYEFSKSATIHKALVTCPNNESLDLRFAMLGCVSYPDRWSLPFDIGGGEKYPSLRHLSLEDYRFDTRDFEGVKPPQGIPGVNSYWYEWEWWIKSGRARQWWRWHRLPEVQRNKTNAQLWADAMDWSKVESIELRDIPGEPFMTHIGPLLTGLKKITLDGFQSTYYSSTGQWLSTLQPLRKLVWFGSPDVSPETFDQILERHGDALEILSVHGQGIEGPGPFFSTSQIRQIGKMAPKLKHLAIAVDRNGTWPFETLEAIASIPQLESVELWMEYISETGHQVDNHRREFGYGSINKTHFRYQQESPLYEKPLLDRPGIEEVWKFMNETSSDALKRVEVYAGDFTRGWDGPLYHPSWLEGLRVGWTCDKEGCKIVDGEDDDLEEQASIDYEW